MREYELMIAHVIMKNENERCLIMAAAKVARANELAAWHDGKPYAPPR